MKNLFSIMAISILSLFLFAGCSSEDSSIEVDTSKLKYFNSSYIECRKSFIDESEKLAKEFNGVVNGAIKVESKIDDDLTINYCYLPAQKKKERLLVLTSGLHGIEGYTGSAVQIFFMKELLSKVDTDKMGILIVHGINPFGFKYKRRVTENNVDLNRNFSIDKSLFAIKNPGYKKVYPLLNPKGKVDVMSFDNVYFPARAIYNIVKSSMKALRDAVLKGQYEFPEGLYFGGKDFEQQKSLLGPLFKSTMAQYQMTFMIDIHTGFGERNRLHLFPNPVKDKRVKGAMETIFEGYRIDWGDSDDFYITTGDFLDWAGKMPPGDKFFVPMLIEFGTMDSQTTKGSITSIHHMILENQGAHYGYDSFDDAVTVQARVLEMYYPSSKIWRSEILRQVNELLPVAVERFSKLER